MEEYFSTSNETYCLVGVIHDKLSKSTHSHISFQAEMKILYISGAVKLALTGINESLALKSVGVLVSDTVQAVSVPVKWNTILSHTSAFNYSPSSRHLGRLLK